MLEISPCTDKEFWNQQISRLTNSTYAHLYQWKTIIEKSYNLNCPYLIAYQNGEPVSLLPITLYKTIRGKKKGVSVAFNSYGGIAGEESQEIRTAYQNYISNNFKIDSLEIRKKAIDHPAEDSSEVTMLLPLKDSEESQWQKFDAKVRNQIRKAEKNKVEISFSQNTNNFYNIYAENMGRLGTPVHSKKFFELILHEFNTHCNVIEASINGLPVGAMITLTHGKTMADPFASTLQKYNKLCPNMLMYWFAIQTAIKHTCQIFDMGRSQMNSGTYSFKKQWGTNPTATIYENLFKNQNSSSTDFYRSSSAKNMSNIWKKLPATLQLYLGPKLRKYIP